MTLKTQSDQHLLFPYSNTAESFNKDSFALVKKRDSISGSLTTRLTLFTTYFFFVKIFIKTSKFQASGGFYPLKIT